jgi:hypothetical protein
MLRSAENHRQAWMQALTLQFQTSHLSRPWLLLIKLNLYLHNPGTVFRRIKTDLSHRKHVCSKNHTHVHPLSKLEFLPTLISFIPKTIRSMAPRLYIITERSSFCVMSASKRRGFTNLVSGVKMVFKAGPATLVRIRLTMV